MSRVGVVLPVGGVLLAESFIEPLSGRMLRVGGAIMQTGQLLPNAGGYQTFLDSKVLYQQIPFLSLKTAAGKNNFTRTTDSFRILDVEPKEMS